MSRTYRTVPRSLQREALQSCGWIVDPDAREQEHRSAQRWLRRFQWGHLSPRPGLAWPYADRGWWGDPWDYCGPSRSRWAKRHTSKYRRRQARQQAAQWEELY